MNSSIPVLDVYYIDLKKSSNSASKSANSTSQSSALTFIADIITSVTFTTLSPAISGLTFSSIVSLKRLIDENHFKVIRSKDELSEFVNANGNDWVTDKAFRQRQYYIRHPKSMKRNLLIESNSFYSYIEEEQKGELINFILSHCPAKSIRIDRSEVIEASGHGKASVKAADVDAGLHASSMNGNYYTYKNPNGTLCNTPREHYFWIDDSLMQSIASLREGASLTQTYEHDFTFGLSIGEAKTIGLDLSHHKHYIYTIEITC